MDSRAAFFLCKKHGLEFAAELDNSGLNLSKVWPQVNEDTRSAGREREETLIHACTWMLVTRASVFLLMRSAASVRKDAMNQMK